ncbi:hypothetical protein BD410DRAFT_805826 [Rickenella mellea]|uniref:Uncharacterized protein n=1 Tax=Rickenella mellea TaxID=50990 RepID=A0A4Y7PWY4_9AGAM|nr:hypothetical protein BD410DRAFT_805826 [Rickenella mellea]
MAAPTPSKTEPKWKAAEVAQESEPSSCETDISRLTSLLAIANISEENADKDLEELLKGLETADGLARGVEDRLDGLLEDLEALLAGLEGTRAEGKGKIDEAENNEKKEQG